MTTLLLLAIFAPLVLMPVVALAGGRWGARVGWLALLGPVVSTGALGCIAAQHTPWTEVVVSWPWVPSLGLSLRFLVDGLSLFFGLVVSAMGVLVTAYARQYLDDHYKDHGRFYAYLLLFMTAMLGTVFAGNLLLLLVFWELTGIASFLLIGFLHGAEVSRAGARMALLVTAGTGLVMLAGVALVGVITGTYELGAGLGAALTEAPPAWVNAAFLLLAVGALGKSAQFPFHFWLPNAMAAPTPVSAYLHSATMVKLGVFLVARLFPHFQGAELWMPLLVPLCFGTMVLGAALALLVHDLKAILAFSTVSQLGFLLGYYGMGAAEGVRYDLLHISSHVFYKGCLFMVVGIVDHATGERDVRRLGGLGRKLPLLAGITAVATASMAGVIGTTGFISKEYALKEAFAVGARGASWLEHVPLVCVLVASTLQVAFAARVLHGVFFGRLPAPVAEHLHRPSLALQLPPLLLAGAVLCFGLFPGALGALLDPLATVGLHAANAGALHLWHGITRELLVSTGILATGLALYAALRRVDATRVRVPRVLAFDAGFERGLELLLTGAKKLTAGLGSDRPTTFLPITIGFLMLVLGAAVVAAPELVTGLEFSRASVEPLRSFVVLLAGIAIVLVLRLPQWTGQLIAMSVVGFLVTFYFVLFRAPDLAMTQILVESATLLLVLLLLSRFPRSAEAGDRERRFEGPRWGRAALAVAAGVGATLLTLIATQRRPEAPAGDYYLAATLPEAQGANAVNTILVDFRGFDTLLEVTVLVVAVLGALGLLLRYRRTAAEYAAGALGPAGYGLARDDNTGGDETGTNPKEPHAHR